MRRELVPHMLLKLPIHLHHLDAHIENIWCQMLKIPRTTASLLAYARAVKLSAADCPGLAAERKYRCHRAPQKAHTGQ
jgi:hypothetical protein